ncbi:7-methylguanosine phosphate-specific 5'-nucleotidase [Toxorhynchites rutilus septentrionalis]|uniref:7-methylguanosine phosphate-specific 5'-nucleotidase n=1 Tax=Toxorhynchites rutilus septentrionalis TaxID=329112 RepID=UPI00247AE7FE|nr:7-methylguanosine phosphate-specific 5'-nucleotidase [Toxorhynchites rutilus septentrionalis]
MVGQHKFQLADVSVLNRDHVKIRDPDKVQHMLNELVAGGIEKLQMVTDFDYTITKQKLDNGEKILTSFGMFNECRSLPVHVLEESQKLFEKYRPIEIDPLMPLDEKIVYMIEWWTKTGELLK